MDARQSALSHWHTRKQGFLHLVGGVGVEVEGHVFNCKRDAQGMAEELVTHEGRLTISTSQLPEPAEVIIESHMLFRTQNLTSTVPRARMGTFMDFQHNYAEGSSGICAVHRSGVADDLRMCLLANMEESCCMILFLTPRISNTLCPEVL